MKTNSLLLLFILFFFNSNYAQEKSWETYTTENYVINYPLDWDFNNSEGMIMDFLALCPLESEDDNLRENINLVKEDAQNLSLEEYFASSIKMLEKTFQKLEVIDTKDLEKEGKKYKQFTYTALFGDEALYFSQIYGIEKNVAYVLTFTSEKDKYTNFQGIQAGIFDSFKLLD